MTRSVDNLDLEQAINSRHRAQVFPRSPLYVLARVVVGFGSKALGAVASNEQMPCNLTFTS